MPFRATPKTMKRFSMAIFMSAAGVAWVPAAVPDSSQARAAASDALALEGTSPTPGLATLAAESPQVSVSRDLVVIDVSYQPGLI